MQNQVTTAQAAQTAQPTGITALKAMLNAESVQQQFQNALGESKSLFIASIIDLCTGDKALQTCEPAAIIKEALRAAVLDLPLTRALGFAYIVVYNNTEKRKDANGHDVWVKVPTPTFIPGYKGYIQLAMRSGQYRVLNADVVYEGELRSHDKLTGEVDINGKRKSDKIIGYFAYFQLLNGYTKMMYMSVEEMAAYAKRYAPGIKKETTVAQLIEKANDGIVSKSVGWMGNFNDMAIKTVIRKLISKFGPMSVKMSNVVASDIDGESRALATREEAVQIAEKGATLDLNANEVEYEEIAPTAAEPRDKSAQAQPASADAEHNSDPY